MRGPRLAEAAGVLAVATDLATGMPLDTTLRICLAALRLADLVGLEEDDRADLYYFCLVRLLGCTVDTSRFARAMGDEMAISPLMAPLDQGDPAQVMSLVLRTVGTGEPLLRRGRLLMAAFAFGSQLRSHMAGHCEVSRMLTEGLRLGSAVHGALDFTYERWDGKGAPKGVRGEAIPLIVRLMQGAYQVVVQDAVGGRDRLRKVARARAGGALDPAVAELLLAHGDDVLEAARSDSAWEDVLAAEPQAPRPLSPAQMDATAEAIAHFADLKSDHLAGHSTGVARLAVAAGEQRGLDRNQLDELRRAGLIHDLGRVAVSSAVWDKPGPLSDAEWEEVRLHAYHTERVASRAPWLAPAARLAGLHHERLDGSGYHRGTRGSDVGVAARLLAAADCYHALTEGRPHRAALPAPSAARVMLEESRLGRLDVDAVRALLQTVGHSAPAQRRDIPGGLTERELEVLRIIAGGATLKEAARHLGISRKTVDAHVQHIYDKVGCTTRAGAAVFAMREGLLEPA